MNENEKSHDGMGMALMIKTGNLQLFSYGFASIFPENIKKQHESHAVSISEQFQIFFYKACSTCL